MRLTRNPEAVRTLLADFNSIDAAARAVSAIVATGIVPAALEMMDRATIVAVEASIYAAGYPVDAAAVLLIELDGLERRARAGRRPRRRDLPRRTARASVRIARDDAERARLWQGRKKAFGAMGRISPHLVVQDAVVPRTKLPEVLRDDRSHRRARIGVNVCNVFHAGDGNLHPNIAYDAGDPDEAERVHDAMREIMKLCIAAGGTVTGEHGVGLDKLEYMPLIFSDGHARGDVPRCARCSTRERRANPGKVVPMRSLPRMGRAPATRVRRCPCLTSARPR